MGKTQGKPHKRRPEAIEEDEDRCVICGFYANGVCDFCGVPLCIPCAERNGGVCDECFSDVHPYEEDSSVY